MLRRGALAIPSSFRSFATFRLLDMVETRSTTRHTRIPPISLPQAVENLLRFHDAQPTTPVSIRHAAVLVPLFELKGDVHVILTQRTAHLRSHGGEVCFPGGKRDAEDVDDAATALREAHEELGIDPSCVEVVSSLPPVLSKHYLSVRAIIGTVPSGLEFEPNPKEVSHCFSAPLRMFLQGGPGYSYRDVLWEPGIPYRLHYWDYVHQGQQFLIWGLTAGLLIMVAERVYNREPEFEVSPPGALPYTALAYEGGRLVFRGGEKSSSATGGSAAVEGAVVMDEEAERAVGCA